MHQSLYHHAPAFSRSVRSIASKCKRLHQEMRFFLTQEQVTITPTDDNIFYHALKHYKVEVTPTLNTDIHDLWEYLNNIHPSIVITVFKLFFQILGEGDNKSAEYEPPPPTSVEDLLYCIDAQNVLAENKLPNVISNFARAISKERFPLHSLLFDFIDENIRFFLLDNSSNMEYHRSTKLLWKGLKDLFGGSAIRYLAGYRSTGQQLSESSQKGVYNPSDSNIVFVLPSETVLNKFNPYKESMPKRMKPGIFPDAINQAVDATPPTASMCLKWDGRKVSPGFREDTGDIDLLGCEEDETLEERREKHASLVSNFDTAINFLLSFDSFSEMKDTSGLIKHFRTCFKLLSINNKELRELKTKKRDLWNC